jgi:hypothetical protein
VEPVPDVLGAPGQNAAEATALAHVSATERWLCDHLRLKEEA